MRPTNQHHRLRRDARIVAALAFPLVAGMLALWACKSTLEDDGGDTIDLEGGLGWFATDDEYLAAREMVSARAENGVDNASGLDATVRDTAGESLSQQRWRAPSLADYDVGPLTAYLVLAGELEPPTGFAERMTPVLGPYGAVDSGPFPDGSGDWALWATDVPFGWAGSFLAEALDLARIPGEPQQRRPRAPGLNGAGTDAGTDDTDDTDGDAPAALFAGGDAAVFDIIEAWYRVNYECFAVAERVTYTLTGRLTGEASLFVDGGDGYRPYDVGADGSFTVDVPLTPGVPLILVRAVLGGAEAYAVVDLRRPELGLTVVSESEFAEKIVERDAALRAHRSQQGGGGNGNDNDHDGTTSPTEKLPGQSKQADPQTQPADPQTQPADPQTQPQTQPSDTGDSTPPPDATDTSESEAHGNDQENDDADPDDAHSVRSQRLPPRVLDQPLLVDLNFVFHGLDEDSPALPVLRRAIHDAVNGSGAAMRDWQPAGRRGYWFKVRTRDLADIGRVHLAINGLRDAGILIIDEQDRTLAVRLRPLGIEGDIALALIGTVAPGTALTVKLGPDEVEVTVDRAGEFRLEITAAQQAACRDQRYAVGRLRRAGAAIRYVLFDLLTGTRTTATEEDWLAATPPTGD